MVSDRGSKRAWGAYAALGIAAGLLLAGHAQDEPNGKAKAPEAQHPTQSQTITPAPPPPGVSVYKASCDAPQTREDAEFCEERKAADAAAQSAYWADWQFWASVAGIVFIVGTLWFTKRAADAALKAADVAERALVDLERPHVFVRFTNPGMEVREINRPLSEGGDEVILASRYSGPLTIEFVNFGRTPAILTELFDVYDPTSGKAAMPYALDPETQRGKPLPFGSVSANGDPHVISKNTSQAFGGRLLKPSDLIDNRFFCLGLLRYRDIMGGEYILGYCAYYDWEAGRFITEGGDAYNVERTLKQPLGRIK